MQLVAESVGKLVLLARDSERLEQLKLDFQGVSNLEVLTFSVDMSEESAVLAIADELRNLAVAPHLVVQAVGKSDRGQITQLTTARVQEQIQANLFTNLYALQHLAPLCQTPGAVVVLIGSLASHFAPRFLGGYALSKHALAALAQQSRLEYADQGIHVMLASPGPIARADAGQRYQHLGKDLPVDALQPGGGAKLNGLDPTRLAAAILLAASCKKTTWIMPWKARALLLLQSLLPRLAEKILRKNTG